MWNFSILADKIRSGKLAKWAMNNIDFKQAFEQTQAALFHTQATLLERTQSKEQELSDLRKAFKETQDALFHTQKVLRDQQVSCGLIDPVSDEVITPDRGLPNILLVCPPKSAGAYVMRTLQRGLRLERRWIANGTFCPDILRIGSLDQFWRTGGCIAFHHTDASEANLFLLDQTSLRILINMRDPRQCILSGLHYALKHFPRHGRLVDRFEPPDDFESFSMEQRIDWFIDNQLPSYTGWISQWCAAIDSGRINALITNYTEMAADEAAFFRKILDFYGIPEGKFSYPGLALNDSVNFRNGEANEWDRVFTPAQKQRARSMIPDDLIKRFGWLD